MASPSSSDAAPPIAKLDLALLLWVTLFVLGGGLLALYYAQIGYFPDFGWEDALTYMALMAIIGGSLLVAYGLLLFVPGAMWSEFLVFVPELQPGLTLQTRDSEPCVLSIAKRVLIPFAAFITFCHCLLYLLDQTTKPGWLVLAGTASSLMAASWLLGTDLYDILHKKTHDVSQRRDRRLATARVVVASLHLPLLLATVWKASGRTHLGSTHLGTIVLWVFALAPAVAPILLRTERFRPLPKAGNSPRDAGTIDQPSVLCRSLFAFDAAALLSFVALWFFYLIYGGDNVTWPLLFVCTFVVIVTNLAVAVTFHAHKRMALVGSLIAALVLLGTGPFLASRPDSLPIKIMGRFRFGVSAALVLTERGGRILCDQHVPVTFTRAWAATARPAPGGAVTQKTPECDYPAVSAHVNDGPLLGHAGGVKLLSRLGSDYLLGVGDQVIALPKQDVISWSAMQQTVEP